MKKSVERAESTRPFPEVPPLPFRGEPTVVQKLLAKKRAWASSPEILKTSHRLIHGDARLMPEIPSHSAHLIVTSPPYWNLKKYRDHRNQLGHISDYEIFHNELDRVWSECHRILSPGGRLCVVVGDVCRSRREFGRHQVVPLHADILRRAQQFGFEPLAPIIWYKISNATTEVAGSSGSFLGKPYEPNAIIKNDIEFILMLRSPGYRTPTPLQRDLSVIEPADHSRWFRQLWADIRGASQRAHPAPFPEEIARRLISMYSFVGDTVVDPFLGTGTTCVAAMSLNRSSIGFEIDSHYMGLARRRFTEVRQEHRYQARLNLERRSSSGRPRKS